MDRAKYPEWGKREAMLQSVYEWCQNRPAGQDMIWEPEVATLVGGGRFMSNPFTEDPEEQAAMKFQEEQVKLFLTLVDKGLIDAKVLKTVAGRRLTQAIVRGLHEKGLQMIQELPDPKQSMIESLDEMVIVIRNLSDVPEDEKDRAAKAADELKQFTRSATPAAAAQLFMAWVKSQGFDS